MTFAGYVTDATAYLNLSQQVMSQSLAIAINKLF
jgi:hypothetical protein